MIERIDPSHPSLNPVFVKFCDDHRKRYLLASDIIRSCKIGEEYELIVDAASGSGLGYPILRAEGRYLGLDSDRETIHKARINYPKADFMLADIEEERTWDNLRPRWVVSLETAEHLDDPIRFFRAVYRSLGPLGRFVFSAPTCLTRDFDPYHKRDWTAGQWRDALTGVGFKIDREVETGFTGRFTDFVSTVPTTFGQKLAVARFLWDHREYRRERWATWVRRNRFEWRSTVYSLYK